MTQRNHASRRQTEKLIKFGETPGKSSMKELSNTNTGKVFCMLMMGNIIIQGVRTLYSATLDGLKIEAENEKMNDVTEVSIIPVIITISLVIHILSLIAIVVFCARYEKWIDKTISL